MKESAGCIFQVVYLGMGLLQFFAIIGGVQEWWGVHWVFSGVIALILAWFPIVGTVVGIMGAVKAWEWSYLAAILLFCWPFVLYLFLMAVAGMGAMFRRKQD